MRVWFLLLACVAPGELPAEEAPAAPPALDPRSLSAMPLPEATPFKAWSRVRPLTLVDASGKPAHVISGIGVELTVNRLLIDRAEVTCTGCRAPVTAWAQRSALFVGDRPADGPHDALLSWLANQENPEIQALRRHGLEPESEHPDAVLLGPPWRDEGGYQGDVLVVTPTGASWTAEVRPRDAVPPAAPEDG